MQRLPGGPTCLPEFVSDGEGDTGCVIDLKDVRHPCLTDRTAASVVVPNDVTLGFGSSRAMLITGPNMGGKSTLMRSTCLAGITQNSQHVVCLRSNFAYSHLGPHGRIRSLQLGEVQRVYVCIMIICLFSVAGCLLSIECSHALVPVTKLCLARARSWLKCLRPLPFSVTRPTGTANRILHFLSDRPYSESDHWSFLTSWDEAAAQATAVPSRSRWCR